MEDESGYSRYSYDAMGNVTENCRTFALAAEDNAYTFIMNTEYDTWGRTLSITYPDKERVSYAYDFGGNLKSVSSAKNGNDKSLVDSIRYDKFGDRTAIYFGNGTTQHYSYNPTSRRLGNLQGRTAANALMQDITYDYDGVGNVTKTDNAAAAIGTLGGPYSCAYTYDHLNRLTASNCQQGNVGYTEQRTYLDDGRIATYDLNGTRQGYSYNTTQPHTLRNIHTLPNRASDVLFSFAWDAKGNMTAQNSQGGSQRNLVWDERNRMLGMVDNAASGNAAHYVYDAQGERTFKLTGYSNHTGSGETSETYVSLDEPTLYASPYLTATATGYTKHYFAGTERLASAIGNGGLADVGQPIVDGDVLADKRRERDTLLCRVMAPYPLRINRNRLDTLYAMTRPDTTAELTYFYHPDHLGSASWITDLSGQPVQHLQYKPFGGDYIDQQDPNTDYTERFRFTGKERDAETGYDYFGARYYSSSLGIWLSVDPMSDKYPSLSPYVYCADNPVNAFDPDGGLPVFLIPLAKGAVGAFVDASAQVSISMINGKSFKEAIGEIDYTSVGAAFVFSAIAAPGASTGAKAATGISKSAKVATKFVTGVAIGVDATTDISANGETSTVFNGGSKSASSFAIDLAATIVPGKVVDNVSSGLSKAIKKDLASNASATLSKEAKASMKHTKDVIDDKGIPGFKGFADFSAGLISGQAKKVIDPPNTKSPSSNRPPMILAPKKNDKAEQSIYRQIIYSK